jgi:hypothetical protein
MEIDGSCLQAPHKPRLAKLRGINEDRVHAKSLGHDYIRDENVASQLVVKRFVNGQCGYDEDARRDLVEACFSRARR